MPSHPEERYEIVRRIGTGGIGAVYEALDRRLGRRVAIKRLLPFEESEDRGGIGQDLLKEARTLSSFQHPNIVTVLDVGTDEEGTYIVMEFIDGLTVDQVVSPIPMSQPIFLSFAEQILDGIIAAHARSLLHRDIKPSNVMLVRQRDGGFRVKILDFGIAKFSRRPALQTVDHSQSILGSIYFMAPEQFERKPLDARTDLYQMGCLLFFALTASFPFDGESTAAVMNAHLEGRARSLAELRPDLAPDLVRWIESHLTVAPASRPASAAASLEALRRIAGRLSSDAAGRPIARAAPAPGPAPGDSRASAPSLQRKPPPQPARKARTASAPVPARPPASKLPSRLLPPASVSLRTPPTARQGAASSRPLDGGSPLRNRWILAGAGAGVVAIVVAGYFAWDRQHRGSGAQSSDRESSPTPIPTTPPALSRLFVQLDAGEGTFRNSEGAPSDIGDVVAEWKDIAPLGGGNPAQYHVTTTPNPESHWPELVRSSIGSRGRALRFRGDQRLVVGRNNGGDPILPHLEGKPFILLVSLEVGGNNESAREFVLGWKNAAGQEQLALIVSAAESTLALTASEPGPGRSSIRPLRPATHEVLVIERKAFDGSARLQLSIARDDGSFETGAPFDCPMAQSDLAELRLGQVLNPGNAGSGKAFSGSLFGVLLYIGDLSTQDLSAAARYLRERRLGSD